MAFLRFLLLLVVRAGLVRTCACLVSDARDRALCRVLLVDGEPGREGEEEEESVWSRRE